MNKLRELFRKYHEIIMYLIFGGLTTLVNFTVYAALRFFGAALLPTNIAAWVCAVLFAYITNKKWVFRSHAKNKGVLFREIISFYGARVFSLLVELALFRVWTDIILISRPELDTNLYEYCVKLFIQVIVIILNYVFSRFFVFAKKKKKDLPK